MAWTDMTVFPGERCPLFTRETDVDRMRYMIDDFWFIVERGDVLNVSWSSEWALEIGNIKLMVNQYANRETLNVNVNA